jgi:hypothetical protein
MGNPVGVETSDGLLSAGSEPAAIYGRSLRDLNRKLQIADAFGPGPPVADHKSQMPSVPQAQITNRRCLGTRSATVGNHKYRCLWIWTANQKSQIADALGATRANHESQMPSDLDCQSQITDRRCLGIGIWTANQKSQIADATEAGLAETRRNHFATPPPFPRSGKP